MAMKTKVFILFLALSASVATIFAESGTCGNDLTWELTNGVLTINGTGPMTNWDYYEDVPWSSYAANITSVIIGNNVTSIGDDAFNGCSSLTSIEIPNSVTRIGGYAFCCCQCLRSITIPNSVTSIGNCAFFSCSSLTNPVYNAHVFAFLPTSYTGVYTIPDGIELIAGSAFESCSGMTSVTIPNSVTSIGDYAFSSCLGLKSATIGNSVTNIGESAFNGCTSLTNVTIPNSVTTIGMMAFIHCRGLTSVTIPNSVTSIRDGAFLYCSGLTSITCEAVTPPTCLGNYVFGNVDKSIPLYVPGPSTSQYKAADVWKDFANILPLRTIINEAISNQEKITKLIQNGQLVIEKNGELFNAHGARVK